MKRGSTFGLALALMAVPVVVCAQNIKIPTQSGRPVRVATRPVTVDAAKNTKLLQDCKGLLAKAGQILQTTLPVYGGRRQTSLYAVQYAQEDVNAALNYRRPDKNGGPLERPTRTAGLSYRERMSRVPPVREKSKREFTSDQTRVSDQSMNNAGVELLKVRDNLYKVDFDYGGRLSTAKEFVNSAIRDIERAIGRIKVPRERIGR